METKVLSLLPIMKKDLTISQVLYTRLSGQTVAESFRNAHISGSNPARGWLLPFWMVYLVEAISRVLFRGVCRPSLFSHHLLWASRTSTATDRLTEVWHADQVYSGIRCSFHVGASQESTTRSMAEICGARYFNANSIQMRQSPHIKSERI